MKSNNQVNSLNLLRGLAVFAVCCCHFGKEPVMNGSVLPGLFRVLAVYGPYGVQVFFVISGFVIPYSFDKAGYRLNDYFTFLYKRFLRLHPPYLISLALSLLIGWGAFKLRHVSDPETFLTIFRSLFYLHIPDTNPVYWTLQVEAEYYLFIGLFFVLFSKYRRLSLYFGIPLLLALGQTTLANYITLLFWIPYFLTGLLAYTIYTNRTSGFIESCLLTAVLAFIALFYPLPGFVAAFLTVWVILFFKQPLPAAFGFLGEISYSIYLIHYPIGTKLINLLQRYTSPDTYWLLFLLAWAVVLLASWLFWKYVERWSAKLAGKIRYNHFTLPD